MRSRFYIIHLSFFLLSSLMLTTCTLSMEEWAEREEDMGKEEPVTVENEYGSITFQFRDSVLYVTDNIQEQFLVRVEADSILYFSDNLPSEWRPYTGMKMAAGISHTLPYGLNSEVLSVEKGGGLYRVVTKRVGIDDVYKNIDYQLDAAFPQPDISGLTEEELKDYGYEMTVDPATGDTIIQDWNEYDVAHGLRPKQAKRRSLKRLQRMTRADDDADGSADGHKDDGLEEEQGDMDHYYRNKWIDFGWDSRKEVGSGRFRFGQGNANEFLTNTLETVIGGLFVAQTGMPAPEDNRKVKPYTAGDIKVVSWTRSHALRDTEKKLEERWTDSWWEFDLGLEVGLQYEYEQDDDDDDDDGRIYNAAKIVKLAKEADTQMRWLRAQKIAVEGKRWNNKKFRVILTTTPIPIALVAGFEFKPIFEVNACASLQAKVVTPTIRTGSITRNGDETPIKNKTVENYDKDFKPGFHMEEAALNGSLKFGASTTLYAGFEFAGTASVTLNIYNDFYFEGKASFDLKQAVNDAEKGKDNIFYNNFTGSVAFKWDVAAKIKFEVAPLGMTVWDHEIDIAEKTPIDHTFPWGASFSSSRGWLADKNGKDYVGGEWVMDNSEGTYAWTRGHVYYPAMKCYFGPVSDNDWVYMRPTDIKGEPLTDVISNKWKDGEQYCFAWEGDLEEKAKAKGVPEITEVHVIPALYYYDGINTSISGAVPWDRAQKYISKEGLEFNEKDVKVEVGIPKVETEQAFQISAGPAPEEGRRAIKFLSEIYVTNGSRLKDWGVKVYVYDHLKKQILKPAKVVRVKNSNRTGRYTFIFNIETNWSEYASYFDKDGKPLEAKDMKFYFRVIPFWDNSRVQGSEKMEYLNAKDTESVTYHPIVFDMKDTFTEKFNKNHGKGWGTVTTKDL